jgi:integrase
MGHKLKDSLVKSLPLPPKGNKIYLDEEVGGFGIRVTAGGSRSFILDYRFHGRQRRYTIGDFPTWSTAAARDDAQRLKRMIDTGTDPQALRDAHNNAPTFDDLLVEYEAKLLPLLSAHSQRDQKSMFKNYIIPHFGKIRLAEIKYADIQEFHSKITQQGKHTRANRIVEVIRKAFNLAIKLEWVDKNPAQGFQRNPELPKERFLTQTEITKIMAILDSYKDNQSANVIRLLMLTGARRSEALKARWDEFDLKAGIWTKPSAHTKQRREHRVPLSKPVITMLKELKKNAEGEYVFPSRSELSHQTDLKHFWESVREKAELDDLRLHDLRHTFASILASDGESLHLIGKMLGHTQAQTTMRYAKFYDEPLKKAAESVGKIVTGKAKVGKKHGK